MDASGRPGFIKRRLGLRQPVAHVGSASWWRVSGEIELDDWSSDSSWKRRVPAGGRRLSTNHLMGKGYWVWLIPLGSGCTSWGIVVDTRHHAFREINSLERSLAWLARHEHQAAEVMDGYRRSVLDFRVLDSYPRACTRVFSTDRWCLTGESGVFLDPFYSPGTDFIAMANTYITDLVRRDAEGDPGLEHRIQRYDRLFLTTFEAAMRLFAGQYSVMGSAQAMSAKGVWDFIRYWGSIAMLAINQGEVDAAVLDGIASDFYSLTRLDRQVQQFLLDWSALDADEPEGAFIDYGKLGFVPELNRALTVPTGRASAGRVRRQTW